MNYDKEKLEAAFANVEFLGDSTWAKNDAYHRANKKLWQQHCALKDPIEKIGRPRSVLDTIPRSRLAQYGTYFYDEEREKSYWGSFEKNNNTILPVQDEKNSNKPTPRKDTTDWEKEDNSFFPEEVEKIFNILLNPYSKTSDLEKRCREVVDEIDNRKMKEIDKEKQIAIEYPKESSVSTLKPNCRILPNYNPKYSYTSNYCHLYNVKCHNAYNLDYRYSYISDYNPNYYSNINSNYKPTYTHNCIHNYNRKLIKRSEKIPEYKIRCPPPVRSNVPPQAPPPRGTAKTFSELVLQMQLHSEEIRSLWDKPSAQSQSLNVNVPEFWPKNSAPPKVPPGVCEYQTILVPSLIPWLYFGYPQRSYDFREINKLISDIKNLGMIKVTKTPSVSSANMKPSSSTVHSSVSSEINQIQQQDLQQQQQELQQQKQQQQQTVINLIPKIIPPLKSKNKGNYVLRQEQQITVTPAAPARRLYSAVLQNQPGETSAIQTVPKTTSIDELEELEREALEQYRPSTESLKRASTDSIISAKYQELERLALEQYNSASTTDTSTKISTGTGTGEQGNESNPLHEPPCRGKKSPYAALLVANSVLFGFYRTMLNTQMLTNINSNASHARFR